MSDGRMNGHINEHMNGHMNGHMSGHDINKQELNLVLSKMFRKSITCADFRTERLQGGTLGDVRLVTGVAETAGGERLPYKVVSKTQKRWERNGDHGSWRREYDLCVSDFDTLFTASFRRPECYRTEMNGEENEIRLWMEYVDGVSGLNMTATMYERAAYELGRWQGRLYAAQPAVLRGLTNLSGPEYRKNFYLYYRSWNRVYDYIRSDTCEIPAHLCRMLIEIDENADAIWGRIEKLPVVFCHRDFWVTNIFYKDGDIVLIDWDTTGWGYMGEDIASLIADEADVRHMVEYYRRCVPAYYSGFREYSDAADIAGHCVRDLILVMFGYRLVEWYMDAGSDGDPHEANAKKAVQLKTLQNIHDM